MINLFVRRVLFWHGWEEWLFRLFSQIYKPVRSDLLAMEIATIVFYVILFLLAFMIARIILRIMRGY